MKTGEVIRMYRKNRNLTQEEMASRLGVTAPAVNKWENNVSLPDITLLAPIARLLETTPDTLLCFREELSQEEVNAFVQEVDEKFQKEDYEQAFEFCRKKICQYPGCDRLVVQLASVLDGWRILKKIPEEEKYDREILGWYKQALESQDAEIKERAAEALFSYYFRKEQYEEAEGCLNYFSVKDREEKSIKPFYMRKRGIVRLPGRHMKSFCSRLEILRKWCLADCFPFRKRTEIWKKHGCLQKSLYSLQSFLKQANIIRQLRE